jgi:hypothetical protein
MLCLSEVYSDGYTARSKRGGSTMLCLSEVYSDGYTHQSYEPTSTPAPWRPPGVDDVIDLSSARWPFWQRPRMR